MTDQIPDPPELDPASLAGTNFSRGRKGFDPTEVRKSLGRAADALRAWHERDERMVERLAELEQRLSASEELDEERITTVLGEETARIVAAAREASAEIRARAEERAAEFVRESEETASAAAADLTSEATALRDGATKLRTEAEAEATQLREDATAEAARLREDAEAAAAALREEATSESNRLREEARAESVRLRDDAQVGHDEMLARASTVLEERTTEAEAVAAGLREAAESSLGEAREEAERIRVESRDAALEEIDRARAEGREMVAEARELRERMLRDLAERRRTARRQIEAARAGRDRVVEALRDAGVAVVEAVEGLSEVDEQAQRAAGAAAAAVDDDIDSVVAELDTGLGAGGFRGVVGGLAEDGEDVGPASGPAAADAEVSAAGSVPALDEPEGTGPTERSPGATVHDLFQRIRSERSGDDHDDADLDGSDDVSDHDAADHEDSVGEIGAGSAARVSDESIDLTGKAGAVQGTGAVADAAGVVPITLPAESVAASEGFASPSGVTGSEATGAGANDADAEPLAEQSELDRRDDLLSPGEKGLVRTLKRLVSDEQNEVLDRLRRIKRGRPEIAGLLPGDEDVAAFTTALQSDFRVAAEAGQAFWGERTGVAGDGVLKDPDALEEPLLARVTEILALRRAHVQKVLDDADADGLELAEMGDHLRAAYREWRSQSVPEQAGDLAAAGFAQGLRDAAGTGTPWCWVPDNGGLPCSDAEDNSLAGPVPCGDEFPTGDVVPPAHPGCRCILVPGPR